MAEQITRTLMLRDRPVARFTIEPETLRIQGKVAIYDPRALPVGTFDRSGAFSRPLLEKWLSRRGIPMTRGRAEDVLSSLGMESTSELAMAGFGFSLSDQYWFLPDDSDMTWEQGNPFTNDFSRAVGHAFAPRDDASASAAVIELGDDIVWGSSAPDANCNGNLPKFWDIDRGERRLYKYGRTQNAFLEPYNEELATRLCARILQPGEYAPARLDSPTFPRALSSTACMATESRQLVAAVDVARLLPNDNSSSMFERYVLTLEVHGVLNARLAVEKMLVVDHLIGNFDRHWSNFGIIQDSETCEWVGTIPLFDMGESFWCDRVMTNSMLPHRFLYPMPFNKEIESQMDRFCGDLSWLEVEALEGFEDEIAEVIALNRFAATVDGFIDRIVEGFRRSVRDVVEHRDRLARMR